MKIRFGTDGWRGIISRDFTFDNVRRVVAAIGVLLDEDGTAGRGVAVGFDRRFLSDQYAAEAAGVLAARGIPVRLAAEVLPTPLVSWAVRDQDLAAGIVITASHNPPEWNGVKLKEPFGGSARETVNRRVEDLLETRVEPGSKIECWPLELARAKGLVQELDVWDPYREALRRIVDFELLRRARLRVGVDPMRGAAAPWLPRLLEEAGCEVIGIRTDANPGFGGVAPEPLESHVVELMSLVGSSGCALGIATDGDGDRIAAVDERGRYFSPHRVIAVLLRYLRDTKGFVGDVAKTVSGTAMLDLLAERYGLEVALTPIGFKHIGEVMLQRKILIGGEESGGIGIAAHLPERDGLLNALLLAEIVAATGRGLRRYVQEIFDDIGYFTYDRVDVRLPAAGVAAAAARLAALETPRVLAGRPVRVSQDLDGRKFICDDYSWLLLRASGTEPVVRVYAEGRSREQVKSLLTTGRQIAGV